MAPAGLHFFPLVQPFFLGLLFILGLLIVLIEIGIIGYAYEKMGLQRRYVFAVLLLSLLGSYVNIPVAELPAERVVSGQEVTFFGMRYIIPLVEERRQTAVAITALLLSRQSAPSLAYISGTLGTLLGADLLNLGRIQELGAPIASIGGAGRFDGIFVTGILAVLLA